MTELAVGARASLSKTITEQDVVAFAELSGDRNPLHLEADFARRTRFGERIAHGGFIYGLISAILGMQLPGPGTIYISETLEFLRPIYFDDTITASAEITAISEDKRIITLSTDCVNQKGEMLAEGESVVLHEAPKPE